MKVARTVLNGESGSNAADLHNRTDYEQNMSSFRNKISHHSRWNGMVQRLATGIGSK